MRLPSKHGEQMIEKTHKSYAVRHTTVIVTGFLQRLSNRFRLPESNVLLELSQFFGYSSLRRINSAHQLRELHVDVERLNLYCNFY